MTVTAHGVKLKANGATVTLGDGDAKTGTTTGTTGGDTVLPIVRNRVRLEAHGVGEVPHAA